MDDVLRTEVLLNFLNTVFAKAVHFDDQKSIEKLSALRHDIYYGDFDYEKSLDLLKDTDEYLNKYE